MPSTACYIVKNLGNGAAGFHYAGSDVDHTIDYSNYNDSNPVNSLAGDSQHLLSFPTRRSSDRVGTHTLYIKEDYWYNAVAESDETNNSKSITFTVTSPTTTEIGRAHI